MKSTRVIQLFLLFICFVNTGNAQLVDNQYGEAFTGRSFFNRYEIKENKIQSIYGYFTHYKLGDGLRKTKLYRAYEFNEYGELIKQLETIMSQGEVDTLIKYYKYDSKHNLTSILTKDKYGISQDLYSYDSLNRIVREEYRKKPIDGNSVDQHSELSSEYSQSIKTATYSVNGRFQQKTIYNSEGKPYRIEETIFNDRGQKIEVMERFRRGNSGVKTTYYYNEEDLLDSLVRVSQVGKRIQRSYSFEYDEFNNLVNKKYYKNGEEVQLQNMIYHNEKRTLENIVIHHFSTNFTRILKLEDYIYFDG
jgi:hypothetical protein